ncbi:hypothetical protein Z949_1129 [Sulfitobacter guttiformis KCTC 32187]|nr:hypothetical protein Z949_1129 [Sulfitobacter guttiformis KCTC 32187]
MALAHRKTTAETRSFAVAYSKVLLQSLPLVRMTMPTPA